MFSDFPLILRTGSSLRNLIIGERLHSQLTQKKILILLNFELNFPDEKVN